MNKLTRLLTWIVKAAVFFVLFAFALNNQQEATVHFAFGHQWRAPMMIIVLTAFAAGMVIGVLGMLPGWWKRRRAGAAAAARSNVAPLDDSATEAPHGV